MPRPRLKKNDITLKEVYLLSKAYYKGSYTKKDDKARRAKIDILSSRITTRRNLKYNRSINQWEQVGRDIEISFIVSTDPKSYKKQDTVKVHKYPVTFIIHDIDKGLDSPFRWRTGSNFRPRFAKKGATKEQRLKITNENINRGIQLQSFFEMEWVSAGFGTLYGPNRTNRPPTSANPDLELFFDKHALYCFENHIVPLLTTKKGALMNVISKNENKKDQ